MDIQREDLNPCTVQLQITCDPEQVREGFERAFKEAAKAVKVPGFRPGRAPRSVVEKQVSAEAVREIAAEIIMTGAYKKAIDELDLKPYSTGAVTLKSLDESEKKCELSAKVPLQPVVEIGDYSSIPIEKPEVAVTDEEVDEQYEDLRRRHSTREAVSDRGLQEGDVAVVNIKVDGEEGEGRNFMTVAGKTFAQMDQALHGMRVEELKQLDLSFPDNFQEKDWAGKTLHCQMTLRSLSAMHLPEEEDFAKSLSMESADQVKKRIKELMIESRTEAAREYVNEQLIEKLMERSSVCVPDTMWESVAKQKIDDLFEELQAKKIPFEEYVKEKGMTEDQFVEAQENEAKTFVMRAQLIQDIFIKEKLTISNLDLNKEVELMAKEYDMTPKELLETLQKNKALKEIQYQAIHRKVMDFLNERAETREAVGA